MGCCSALTGARVTVGRSYGTGCIPPPATKKIPNGTLISLTHLPVVTAQPRSRRQGGLVEVSLPGCDRVEDNFEAEDL